MAIVAIKESKLRWALSVSAAACESCADPPAGQDSQLGISSSFYTLSPFCSPSAVSQLFLTTDINLAGLLFPALSSDPLFFACPGWVQLNWFFLFSFCFQSFCLRGALHFPSCSFCFALSSQHSCVTATWPLQTFLWHEGTPIKFSLCPCTDCSHVPQVPVALCTCL